MGELVRHKRAELAVEAAIAAGRRLKLVVAGPSSARCARPTDGRPTSWGRFRTRSCAHLYAGAQALVVPNVEEFGIAAVEAQAAGRPVVGIDAGGLRETVVPGRTGLLVPPDDLSALTAALRDDFSAFDPASIRAHAEGFARPVFQAKMRALVKATCG